MTDFLERHKRHILLKEIGGPGVQKLAGASVCLIGAGALGGPCALYLAAAGIGQIELIDDDVVEASNLQRQVQFKEADIGQAKTDVLARQLKAMNSDIDIRTHRGRFEEGMSLTGDILIDACDNFQTRFSLNKLAHRTRRVLVHGAATGWQGQVSVFASGRDKGAPCYRCWVPEAPDEGEDCETLGVVGPVTGLIGTRMALETLKVITGAGEPLIGRLWLLDGLSGQSRLVSLPQDPACPHCVSV